MRKMDTDIDVVDVQEMTDRVMIDLFKQKLQETDFHQEQLTGTWSEASNILRNHFGKISRIMTSNQFKLQSLYQAALKELGQR
jgi:hypothetical protein